MKLTRIFQNINNENPVDNVDLIIACCGYELRCTSLIQFYQENVKKVRYKRAICFNEPKTEFLNNNQDQFKNHGFFLYDVKPNDDFAKRLDCIGELLGDIEMKDSMIILIDYSSMNREWYSAILIYLEHFFPRQLKLLSVDFIIEFLFLMKKEMKIILFLTFTLWKALNSLLYQIDLCL